MKRMKKTKTETETKTTKRQAFPRTDSKEQLHRERRTNESFVCAQKKARGGGVHVHRTGGRKNDKYKFFLFFFLVSFFLFLSREREDRYNFLSVCVTCVGRS